jgi:hypothetical protein
MYQQLGHKKRARLVRAPRIETQTREDAAAYLCRLTSIAHLLSLRSTEIRSNRPRQIGNRQHG